MQHFSEKLEKGPVRRPRLRYRGVKMK